jgi:mercuric ion transport protein
MGAAVYSALMEVLLVHLFNYTARIKQREVHVVDKVKWEDKPHLRWLTLFITSGTLLCCALPILLVSMGFGAVVASLNYNIPGLIFLAEHKLWTLSLSLLLLVFLAWVIWRPNQTCPVDPKLAATCKKAKRWNQRIFWLSAVIWMVGFFFSILLLPLRQLLNL